jgi:hypothetical protein
VELSQGGLAFELPRHSELASKKFVVGVETPRGELAYAAVEIRGTRPTSAGVRVEAAWCEGAADLLRPQNLVPTLNRDTLRFETTLSPQLLEEWAAVGVLSAQLMDYVQVCPQCRSLPSFRRGCRHCGSARVQTSQLIHHFACAHVGHVHEFEQRGELVCPKCRGRDLIVGAEFDYVSGPFTCMDCQWSDSELEQIGQCLACDLRFPQHQAVEVEIIGYHVERLDPLALLQAS